MRKCILSHSLAERKLIWVVHDDIRKFGLAILHGIARSFNSKVSQHLSFFAIQEIKKLDSDFLVFAFSRNGSSIAYIGK
ncbi:hypothetical protein D3C73_528200 [compost metagenome]